MYNRILFDIDGTLVDSEGAVRRALSKLMKEVLNVDKSPEEVAFYVGMPGIDSLRVLGFDNPEEADKRWAELLHADYDDVALQPGVPEMLAALQGKGFKLGIVTSKSRHEYMTEFQSRFHLEGFFEGYVCFDDTTEHKPSPAPILEYLNRFGGDPSTTLFVGDTVHDFNSAYKASVDFALACWGAKGRSVIQARFKAATPADILHLPGIA